MHNLSIAQSLTGLSGTQHQGGGDICLKTRHLDWNNLTDVVVRQNRSNKDLSPGCAAEKTQHSTAQHSTAQHSTAQHSRCACETNLIILVSKATPVQQLDSRLKAEQGLLLQKLPVLWLQHTVALL